MTKINFKNYLVLLTLSFATASCVVSEDHDIQELEEAYLEVERSEKEFNDEIFKKYSSEVEEKIITDDIQDDEFEIGEKILNNIDGAPSAEYAETPLSNNISNIARANKVRKPVVEELSGYSNDNLANDIERDDDRVIKKEIKKNGSIPKLSTYERRVVNSLSRTGKTPEGARILRIKVNEIVLSNPEYFSQSALKYYKNPKITFVENIKQAMFKYRGK